MGPIWVLYEQICWDALLVKTRQYSTRQKKMVLNGALVILLLQSVSKRAEALIGQFNDALNKTEYNEVPLSRRAIDPFMDSVVVSLEEMI